MFRRKEDGSIDTQDTSDAPVSYNTATSGHAPSASAPSAPAPSATAPAAQPAPSFRPAAPAAAMAAAQRANPPMQQAPAASTQTTTPAPAQSEAPRVPASPIGRGNAASKRVLTVGPEIQMKGEVTSCDRVIIEGSVDATMRDVHTVELAESGSLKGTAEVEDAEISGNFEGDLVVRGRLTVYSSGRVRGNVTYGEIEIQRGGQLSGNIRNAAEAKQGNLPMPSAAKKAA